MVTMRPTSAMGSGEAVGVLKVANRAMPVVTPVGGAVEPCAPHRAAVNLAAVQVRDGADFRYRAALERRRLRRRVGRRVRCGCHLVCTSPVSRARASRYLSLVRAITSAGRFGPGAFLSQSSVSR